MLPRVTGGGGVSTLAGAEAAGSGEGVLAAASADGAGGGAHGGGGHAVVSGVASALGTAASVETETSGVAAPPRVFSGAFTGGSPSHPRSEGSGATETKAVSTRSFFMVISVSKRR